MIDLLGQQLETSNIEFDDENSNASFYNSFNYFFLVVVEESLD